MTFSEVYYGLGKAPWENTGKVQKMTKGISPCPFKEL
jgi:hypothetical protein